MKWVLPADSTGDYYFVFHPAYLLRCVAYFFAGAFLVNAIPHFVSGVTGHRFPSPFASPPGKGLSSPIVNVLWGIFNFAIAYLLIFRVGTFDFRSTRDMLLLAAGGLLMGINLAGWFGRTDHDESRSQ